MFNHSLFHYINLNLPTQSRGGLPKILQLKSLFLMPCRFSKKSSMRTRVAKRLKLGSLRSSHKNHHPPILLPKFHALVRRNCFGKIDMFVFEDVFGSSPSPPKNFKYWNMYYLEDFFYVFMKCS